MPIQPGSSYRIKNQRSNLYLSVVGNSLEESALLEQRELQPDGQDRLSQVWHVFPLDFGSYLLVNKASGLVVNIAWNSTISSARAEQYRLQTPGAEEPAQQWLLRDSDDGAYEIINNKSQQLLNVVRCSKEPAALIEQYPHTSDERSDAQRWLLEVEDEYKVVANLTSLPDTSIGDIHRMTSYQPTPANHTDQVEIAAMAYPFVLVDDPALDRQRQAQENPYYILRRYGFWQREYSYEHGGAAELAVIEQTTVGLTTTDASEVEKTASISVSAEAGFGLHGFGASLTATISNELMVTTTHEEVRNHSREKIAQRTYPAGKRVTEAVWYRSDRYVLERLDGTAVLRWTTRNPNMTITDAYPSRVPKSGPRKS
jgi:Insecticidal Crystal Toxin, P42/Ricin-type beta-trefoil lectin domain-like